MKTYLKIVGLGCVVILNIFLVVYTFSLFRTTKSTQAENTTLRSQLQAEIATPVLPTTAVKVSECVPFMGEHWVAPESIPNGPFYLVSNGKILGVEYMFAPEDILGQQQANMTKQQFVAYLQKNNLTLGDVIKKVAPKYELQGLKYKNFSIEWSSPHAGQPKPHYDIHFYMVDTRELDVVCPKAKVEDTLTPQILDTIKKYNIPFPGIPSQKKP